VSEALNGFRDVYHADMRVVKPLDTHLLEFVFSHFNRIICFEEACELGGFGSLVLQSANSWDYQGKIQIYGIPDEFVGHGTYEELIRSCELDVQGIEKKIAIFLEGTD
jgi:1-deoxy-D-xylulose-5-phosphate synthase